MCKGKLNGGTFFNKRCWNKWTPLCKNLTLGTYLTSQIKYHSRDFPGCQVVRTPSSQCWASGFNPWLELQFHKLCGMAQNRNDSKWIMDLNVKCKTNKKTSWKKYRRIHIWPWVCWQVFKYSTKSQSRKENHWQSGLFQCLQNFGLYIFTMEFYLAIKRMKYCHLQQNEWT